MQIYELSNLTSKSETNYSSIIYWERNYFRKTIFSKLKLIKRQESRYRFHFLLLSVFIFHCFSITQEQLANSLSKLQIELPSIMQVIFLGEIIKTK